MSIQIRKRNRINNLLDFTYMRVNSFGTNGYAKVEHIETNHRYATHNLLKLNKACMKLLPWWRMFSLHKTMAHVSQRFFSQTMYDLSRFSYMINLKIFYIDQTFPGQQTILLIFHNLLPGCVFCLSYLLLSAIFLDNFCVDWLIVTDM